MLGSQVLPQADVLFLLSLTASPAASEDLTDAMSLSELDTAHDSLLHAWPIDGR